MYIKIGIFLLFSSNSFFLSSSRILENFSSHSSPTSKIFTTFSRLQFNFSLLFTISLAVPAPAFMLLTFHGIAYFAPLDGCLLLPRFSDFRSWSGFMAFQNSLRSAFAAPFCALQLLSWHGAPIIRRRASMGKTENIMYYMINSICFILLQI